MNNDIKFNQTLMNKISSNWETVKLGDYLEEKKIKNRKNQKLPVYSISNIYGFILSEKFFDKQVYSKSLKNYKLVKKDDFAYNPARINVGSIGLFEKKISGLVSPMYIVFRISRLNDLFPKFLYILLKSSKYIEKIKNIAMSRGSVRNILTFDDLCNLKIPIPPLPIQQKIVYILDTIQEAVGVQEKIIEKTKELKKSLMADLFKYGGPSFRKGRKLKKTEIGEIPEDWEVVRLGEIFTFTSKPKNLKLNENTVIPFIPMEEIGFSTLNPKYYMKPLKKIPSGVYFEKGDLLLAKITPSFENGKQSIVEVLPTEFGIATTEVIPLKGTDRGLIKYIFYLLQMDNIRSYLVNTMEGTTGRRRLSKTSISSLKIPLSSLSEQQEIAEILQTIDQKIEIEQKKKALYEELFKTMLNKLMNGEIDVENLNLENEKF